MEEKKDLANKESGALRVSGGGSDGAENMPAGFDGLEEGDIKMPRLSILQGLSQLCIDGKGKMGELANSITKEIYGAEIDFIPLFMFKTRAQFEQGRGLVMMSRDNIKVTMGLDEFEQYIGTPVEEVPGAAWEGKTPPKFNEVYNIPVLLIGNISQFPISISMMRTAVKSAKEFLSMARYSGEDMFARVYTLKSRIDQGKKGTYAVPVIGFKRRCTDEEYSVAKKIFDKFYRLKSKIDVELEDDPTADLNE